MSLFVVCLDSRNASKQMFRSDLHLSSLSSLNSSDDSEVGLSQP